jgi:hypothetical protein
MIRVEKLALTLATKSSDQNIRNWCYNNIFYRPVVEFLNLNSSSLHLRLGTTKVSTRTYFNILRLIVLNITATNPAYLGFLKANKTNIQGYKYLTYSGPYVKIFGEMDPTKAVRTNQDHNQGLSLDPARRVFAQGLNLRDVSDIFDTLVSYLSEPPILWDDLDDYS